LPAPSNDRNSNGGSGPFLLSPLLPSSSSSPRLRRVSDLPINTCLLSSRPKPTPSSCPWGAESTPKDAGRTPRFLRFQVKSREPTASALSSHSADFFLSFCGFLSFLAFTWMPCSNYGALAGNQDLAGISIHASARWLVLALYLSSPRTLIRTGSSVASRPSRPWAWDPIFVLLAHNFTRLLLVL
jgi:hypothetical protein